MAKMAPFSAVVIPEGKVYAAWCPELDVASQGSSVEEAIANLREALELHLECMSPKELAEIRGRVGLRLNTTIEIAVPA